MHPSPVATVLLSLQQIDTQGKKGSTDAEKPLIYMFRNISNYENVYMCESNIWGD